MISLEDCERFAHRVHYCERVRGDEEDRLQDARLAAVEAMAAGEHVTCSHILRRVSAGVRERHRHRFSSRQSRVVALSFDPPARQESPAGELPDFDELVSALPAELREVLRHIFSLDMSERATARALGFRDRKQVRSRLLDAIRSLERSTELKRLLREKNPTFFRDQIDTRPRGEMAAAGRTGQN